MKGILRSIALLLVFGASHATLSAQEYEERPLPPRRPASADKERIKPRVANSNATADIVRIASSGATVRGDGDAGNPPASVGGATSNATVVKAAPVPVNDAPATVAPAIAAPAVSATAPSTSLNVKMPPPLPEPAAASPAPKTSAPAISKSASTANAKSSNSAAPASTAPAVSPAVVATTSTAALPLTSIYRVGEGDTLDIRILNYEVQSASTLYTVLGGGLLEYPLIGEPLVVSGLTTDDIDARVTAELKRREVFEEPQVVVSVREYLSHTATISGLVENPGVKVMRREALPLYVLLAEAAPRPEAGQVVITSPTTNTTRTIDLADAAAGNTLVNAGDVLRISVRPPQFFYIGGEVGAPGQKNFHAGLTLTQAVLASGGITRNTNGRVRVSRQGADGRLIPTEYNLKEIETGRTPDPLLQSGDRIELGRK